QAESGPHVEVSGVDVAGARGRRKNVQRNRVVGGDAHGAAKGLEWNPDVLSQLGVLSVAEVEVAEVGLAEVVGEQAEARDSAGPAPLERFEREHLDLENVARLRPADVNRAGEGVEAVEVELGQGRGR